VSITTDFELRQKETKLALDQRHYWYGVQDVVKLLHHSRQLEAMLKKREWSGFDTYGNVDDSCPECMMIKVHESDCPMAILLDGV
jgi:sulfatase maturation enzyme AslB (radical SAM superfamily)